MDDLHSLQVPKSLDAEYALIGSMMFNPMCIDEVVEIVTKSDFFSNEAAMYFELIVDVKESGKPVDLITISDEAKTRHKLNCIGDLAEISKNTPSYSNAVAYAKVISQKSMERGIIIAAQSIIANVYSSKEGTDDKLDYAEAMIMSIRKDKELDFVEPVSIVSSVITSMEKQFTSGESVYGLPTGYPDMDYRFNGWREGDLVILAGRPSMGKSTLAQNIAEYNSIELGKPVLLFSLEMSKEDIVKRSMASVGGIEFDLIRTAQIYAGNVEPLSVAAKKIAESKLYIDDRSSLSLTQVRAKARRMKRKHPDLSLIIVDYLQLMNAKSDSREREIATISAGLKELARELKIPVLALSQLSRSLESRNDKRPVMSDLRESGAIEQDADIIMFIYRDSVYNENSDEGGVAHIITRKFRNGNVGTDYLQCEFNKMRFLSSPYRPAVTKKYAAMKSGGTFNYDKD